MKNEILPQTKSGDQGKPTPSAWVIETVPATQPNSLAQELKAVREENAALTKRVSWLEAQMQAFKDYLRNPNPNPASPAAEPVPAPSKQINPAAGQAQPDGGQSSQAAGQAQPGATPGSPTPQNGQSGPAGSAEGQSSLRDWQAGRLRLARSGQWAARPCWVGESPLAPQRAYPGTALLTRVRAKPERGRVCARPGKREGSLRRGPMRRQSPYAQTRVRASREAQSQPRESRAVGQAARQAGPSHLVRPEAEPDADDLSRRHARERVSVSHQKQGKRDSARETSARMRQRKPHPGNLASSGAKCPRKRKPQGF